MHKLTKLNGDISIEPPLNKEEIEYFTKFSNTRRIDRKRGPYFVGGSNNENDNIHNDDILDFKTPPSCQPSSWCNWSVDEEGKKLFWNNDSSIENAKEWLDYIVTHFFGYEPVAKLVHSHRYGFFNGHKLNGTITVQKTKEESPIYIIAKNNIVSMSNSLYMEEKQDIIVHSKEKLLKDIERAIDYKIKFITSYQNESIVVCFNQKKLRTYHIT